ncbi:ABC transporter ATP-binding protein [Cytobacillus purgationiresistens]|uniref:ABC-2 type transport system ATP-binding protein n=1 Tax=Cytobacillus purgationiresistens TaxID=863449 RepID=A0ABU0AB97_9BACI|nr:ABC transporter ATP-binding protein [Cytobacillus purgationiresistens]MDQ0268524.1 ABC-2 type transport system ATP-binding protein [Cytobacillus purgationiresistens]
MILSVNQVHKSYGKEKILTGISFEINEPNIIALIGPNGSGKSTLLSIITNLVATDQGEVMILNKSNKDPNIFREIAFMQDNSVLYDYLTGYDHLQFIGDIQNITKEEIYEAVERIGMTSYLHKKVGKYSLGMKQHLLLTMAILNKPKLLLLDEPLNGLDPTSAIKVRNLLLALLQEGTAIIISSHNLSEIDLITRHIIFLKDGKIIKENIPQNERVYYELTVDDYIKAQEIILAEKISVKLEGEKLLLQNTSTYLSEIIRLLSKEEVNIQDIEKKTLGSEDRYQKIFGQKGHA